MKIFENQNKFKGFLLKNCNKNDAITTSNTCKLILISVPGLIFIIQFAREAGGSLSERDRVTMRDYRERMFHEAKYVTISFEIVIKMKYDKLRVRMLYVCEM